MRKILLLILSVITVSRPCIAQSDEGWFTGRLALYTTFQNNCIALHYTQLYNFENHFSTGVGIGINYDNIFESTIPITVDLRIRPLGHKNFMPSIYIMQGYGFSTSEIKGSSFTSIAIGIETGHIKPIRFCLYPGYLRFHKENMFTISVGITL